MKKEKLNVGNVIGTFQPEFIAKITALSEDIQNIDTSAPDASIDIQNKRAELIDARKDLELVKKFINQEIVILTGKTIEAKRKMSFDQTSISIFDFVGKKDEEDVKELEFK